MKPEKVTRLKVTLCAAEMLGEAKASSEDVEAFISREGGRHRFSCGANHVSLLGLTGTSTVSLSGALQSWARKASRKLDHANASNEDGNGT